MSRRSRTKKPKTKSRTPRGRKGAPMARGQLTKTQYRNFLQRVGELVGNNVREVVPERSVIIPAGGAGTARHALPPQVVTRDELVQACAATAGAVIGSLLDLLGVDVVEDPPVETPKPKLVT